MRSGIHIRSGHVFLQPQHPANLADVGAAQAFQFPSRKRLGIADDAALATTEWDVDHRGFPGHPSSQGADGIDGLAAVIANTTLVWAARIVVLDPEATEDLSRAIVHLHRERHVQLTQRPAQKFVYGRVELKQLRSFV